MYGSDADDGGGGEPTVEEAGTGGTTGHPSVVDTASLDTVVHGAAAETPTVRRATLKNTDHVERSSRVASILVAVGSGPHSGATVDVARRLAETTDAWLELFHVTPSESATDATNSPPDGQTLLTAARERVDGFERADRFLVDGESAAEEITEQSAYYDLVVVGATTTGTVGRFVFGCTTDAVVDDAAVPVVVVESDEPTPLL